MLCSAETDLNKFSLLNSYVYIFILLSVFDLRSVAMFSTVPSHICIFVIVAEKQRTVTMMQIMREIGPHLKRHRWQVGRLNNLFTLLCL